MNASCAARTYREIFSHYGCKLTHQRLEIYRQLSDCHDHPSAEVLHQRVAENLPMISLETVYRSLNKFERLGMVSRIHTTNRRAHFDANVTPHSHFICTQCHDILDLNSDEFDLSRIQLGANGWGQVAAIDVVLTGVCRKCQDNDAMPPN